MKHLFMINIGGSTDHSNIEVHDIVFEIAESIEDQLKTQCNQKVYHKEGVQNGIWILLDFIDIVVHIFQTEARQFYNLEGLWGDGILTKYPYNPEPKSKA